MLWVATSQEISGIRFVTVSHRPEEVLQVPWVIKHSGINIYLYTHRGLEKVFRGSGDRTI